MMLILLLDVVVLFVLRKMFEVLIQDKVAVWSGVFLFLTCPYKVYVSYVCMDISRTMAWLCIVFTLWGVLEIIKNKKKRKGIFLVFFGITILGYVDFVLLLIVLGITGLALIWNKNIYVLFPAILGLIISVPGWIKWVKFLLYGMPISEVEVIKSISREGYSIGQFFTVWTYRDDHPGLGLPLSIACILLIWCLFVDREVKIMEKQGFFLFVFLLMSFMSMKCFPWEMIQRLTGVFLRLVSAFETPTVFWGFASLSACVLGAYGVELTRRGKYVLFRE